MATKGPMAASEAVMLSAAWLELTSTDAHISSDPKKGATAKVNAHALYQLVGRLMAAEKALAFYADANHYQSASIFPAPFSKVIREEPAGATARDHLART